MKRFTVQNDKQFEIIKKCENSGIKVKTMFIIGNPEDNEETIKKQLLTQLTCLVYIVSTVFLLLIQEHRYSMNLNQLLKRKNMKILINIHRLLNHKYLDYKKIENLKSMAYFKFYFNIKRILRILSYFLKSKYT